MALLQIAEPGQSPLPHQVKRAAGIDLGTTNSALAYVDLAAKEEAAGSRLIRFLEIPQLVAQGEVARRAVLEDDVKTYSMKASEIAKEWLVVDATGIPLGRLATRVATFLRGKHKPTFQPNLDMGDNVIVLNAAKVKITGQKREQKVYLSHTGYMGGQRVTTMAKLMEKRPEEVVLRAVKGMLPKNPLGRAMFKKLKVYSGAEHPHTAQQPQTLEI